MTTFQQGTFRKGFDGSILLALDTATPTVYPFPTEQQPFTNTDNNGYPKLSDAAAILHNKVPGVKMGQISLMGPMQFDRGWDTFLTNAFGARTSGLLTPWTTTVTPYSGASSYNASGIYFTNFRMGGQFNTNGLTAAIRYALNAYVLDPLDFLTAPTLTPPAASGTEGVDISSFMQSAFSDGNTTTYDGIQVFDVQMDNGMEVQPAMKNVAQRISAGCSPYILTGRITLGQLCGATNAIPQGSGNYPLRIAILTGDGNRTFTLNLALSWDNRSRVNQASKFNGITASYALFGTASITGGYMFSASYA